MFYENNIECLNTVILEGYRNHLHYWRYIKKNFLKILLNNFYLYSKNNGNNLYKFKLKILDDGDRDGYLANKYCYKTFYKYIQLGLVNRDPYIVKIYNRISRLESMLSLSEDIMSYCDMFVKFILQDLIDNFLSIFLSRKNKSKIH